jgi:hypothetical protein
MTPGMRQAGGDAVRDAEARERRAANNAFNAEPVQYGHQTVKDGVAEPSAASTTQAEPVTTEEAATPASSPAPAAAVTDFDPAILADLFSPESDQ